jgi:hypothetical protein
LRSVGHKRDRHHSRRKGIYIEVSPNQTGLNTELAYYLYYRVGCECYRKYTEVAAMKNMGNNGRDDNTSQAD